MINSSQKYSTSTTATEKSDHFISSDNSKNPINSIDLNLRIKDKSIENFKNIPLFTTIEAKNIDKVISGRHQNSNETWIIFLSALNKSFLCGISNNTFTQHKELTHFSENKYEITIPIKFNKNTNGFLCYKKNNHHGSGYFYKIDQNGSIFEIKKFENWRKSWTHIVPLHCNDVEGTILCFYHANGECEFYNIDDINFTGVGEIKIDMDWKQIIPIQLNGSKKINSAYYVTI